MSNQLIVFWDLTANDRHILVSTSTNTWNLEILWQQNSFRRFVSYRQLVVYYWL